MKATPFTELRRRTDDRLANVTGNRHAFGPEDYARAFNEALVQMGRFCYIFDPMVRLTLTNGDQRVDLQDPEKVSRRVIQPLKIWIASQERGEIVTLSDLDSLAPHWREAQEGSPNLGAWHGGRELIFDRPVDMATAARSNYLSAYIIPAVIGSDGTARPMGFTTEREATGDQWTTAGGTIGTVTYTTTSGSCTTASGNPNDLGAADGTVITARYPTPECTDVIE
ncbi:MAG TPA: hypothetical protein PLS15_12760 [Fimbriimonadaceae bacterium]|nr:hypothetical protein [Fimbriimonadaceae bacterium]